MASPFSIGWPSAGSEQKLLPSGQGACSPAQLNHPHPFGPPSVQFDNQLPCRTYALWSTHHNHFTYIEQARKAVMWAGHTIRCFHVTVILSDCVPWGNRGLAAEIYNPCHFFPWPSKDQKLKRQPCSRLIYPLKARSYLRHQRTLKDSWCTCDDSRCRDFCFVLPCLKDCISMPIGLSVTILQIFLYEWTLVSWQVFTATPGHINAHTISWQRNVPQMPGGQLVHITRDHGTSSLCL